MSKAGAGVHTGPSKSGSKGRGLRTLHQDQFPVASRPGECKDFRVGDTEVRQSDLGTGGGTMRELKQGSQGSSLSLGRW